MMRGFADRTGLEPATSAVTGRHSNQLNYRSKFIRECKYKWIRIPSYNLLLKNVSNNFVQTMSRLD